MRISSDCQKMDGSCIFYSKRAVLSASFYLYLCCSFVNSLKIQCLLILFIPDSPSLPDPLHFPSPTNHVSFSLLFLKPSLTVDAPCIFLDVWFSTEGYQPARGCTLKENWLSLPCSHPSPVASELRECEPTYSSILGAWTHWVLVYTFLLTKSISDSTVGNLEASLVLSSSHWVFGELSLWLQFSYLVVFLC